MERYEAFKGIKRSPESRTGFLCNITDHFPFLNCFSSNKHQNHGNKQFFVALKKDLEQHRFANMESLIRQTRARFSGTRQDNKEADGSSARDRKIPPQKTQSFAEKRRSKSWIRRQWSRQMSWDYDFSGSDYPAAVAAAAFAIQSLEESKTRDQKETTYGPDKSVNKTKSKVEDIGVPPEPLKSALKSSDGTRTSSEDPDNKLSTSTSSSKRPPEKAPSIKKRISFADTDETLGNKPEKPALEKAPERAPPMKKPPTFADKQLNTTEGKKTDTTVPKPDRPAPGLSTTQPVETRKQSAAKPGHGDSKADDWEKEELESIRDRYQKLRATIENWETKKKKKAKRKLERIEAELDKRRAKVVQSYHSDIKRIEGIAGGAKAQAEKNRKNEELKVKEKANKIRLTGKLPATCLCF
ncbi:hypothetical protein Sango_1049400 [Sesamum angolense]|uniref:Remorin C-terminal domain-containing protein n=1 Tax=Sesamum angolense TaxID=2727404 RepID=A0AAE1X0J2_9LAMI|nr:hypothetical protein Sango_1049400 [Sesamum angolense]